MFSHPLLVFSVLASGIINCLAETPLEPRWGDVRTKHAWGDIPEHWETLGHPPAGTTIDLHIALEPQRKNAVVDTLYEVSFPRSPKYGAHLSKEQLADLVEPHPNTLTLVNSWLKHHGVHPSSVSRSHGGGWLTVTNVPVSQANDLLSASYQLYRHAETNDTVLRTISYGFPAELHSHIKTIAPTTYFSSPRMLRHATSLRRAGTMATTTKEASLDLGRGLPRNDDDDGDDEEGIVTPSALRWIYNTLGYGPAAIDRNKLGIIGFLGDSPSPNDLKKFMTEYRTDGEDASFKVIPISGGQYDPNKPSVEGNLDTQYAQSMAFPTPHSYYSTGGKLGTVEPYLNWLNYMLGLDDGDLPQTITASYGGFEENIPPDFAENACELFAKLGVRGASILFSTGDFGVGKDCVDSSGNVRFRPRFPASCPWVTGVGATMKYPEIGAFFSGGGFSNLFPRPDYQDGAVPTYLETLGDQYSGLYNPAGRGIPDIAMQGHRCSFVHRNDYYTISGTSCAVPIAAGIVSLLNDYRLSKGKTPLGFLNYWLYYPEVADIGINDITFGANPGCGTNGFSANSGWDPVTGLGSLDFSELEELLDDL
ncbi:subtilisin-like protein [Lactarius indigo]|nr:subtilisin-like protein [Lactarius indigo]